MKNQFLRWAVDSSATFLRSRVQIPSLLTINAPFRIFSWDFTQKSLPFSKIKIQGFVVNHNPYCSVIDSKIDGKRYLSIDNSTMNDTNQSITEPHNSLQTQENLNTTSQLNNYDSIRSIKQDILSARNIHFEQILRKHSFVGVIDSIYSLCQYETKLLIINHKLFSEQLFYQLCIHLI